MKQKWVEQSVLFASVLKWFVIASIIGIVVGASTTLFLKLLGAATTETSGISNYYLLLPIGLFLSSWLIQTFAPQAEGHGTEQVIEAIHKRHGRIKPAVVPVKLLATIITLSLGGSAGKEGPCAQIGAGIASGLCDLFRVKDLDRTKLVICGISAGFSSVFGTPIAGAIFAVEVLAIGRIQYAVLFPSFVAGIMAYQTSTQFGVHYFHSNIHYALRFSEPFFAQVMLIGVACGLCSFLFVEMLLWSERLSHQLQWWKPLKGLVGGGLVLLTVFISPRYLGLGLGTIEQNLTGQYTAHWYDFLLKMYATAITLSFGGSGGIITPIFFIGSTFGGFLANTFHMNVPLVAALGMVGLLSGCANTPISASILAMELFGTEIGSYAAIVSVISFVIIGHRSVYPSQILSLTKSDSLKTNVGETIQDLEPPTFVRDFNIPF